MAKKALNQSEQVEQEEIKQPLKTKRFYKGDVALDSDLFKLEVAFMQKNQSWTDIPHYVPTEHVHFYRTVDSRGKKLFISNEVGGHFHEVTATHLIDGTPDLIVSTPKKHVWKKDKKGRMQKVTVDVVDDSHSHKSTYLRSQKVTTQEVSVEAAKFEAAVQAKMSPPAPEGIFEKA